MAREKTQSNPFESFMGGKDLTGGGVVAALNAQAKAMDAVLRQNIELLDFLKTRYEKDRALLAQFADADTPGEMMTLWSSFWSRAMTDYANEAGKLGALGAATAEQVLLAGASAELAEAFGKKKG
ncbi:MAG: phasin family protein [Defluviimonas sp.]|uniref:phasin family protein n=1 Tax=Albidovulum sp. TaxID=1872424 RepID=UPI001D824387|nr:phasin family protein [Paracoccaceae bacterium]MCC0063658.1 phasin family protein [Defluviimonas sp.]